MLAVVLVIYFEPMGSNWSLSRLADPVGTIIYAVLSILLACMQFKQPLHIMMQGHSFPFLVSLHFFKSVLFSGSPFTQAQFDEVYSFLLNQRDVVAAHDIRIWTLGHNGYMFSAHIVTSREKKGNCDCVE